MAELPPVELYLEPRRRASISDWVWGFLLSVLLPMVGLVVGCVFVSQGGGRTKVGAWCICISLLVLPMWISTVF
ncbi:MAG TPA: hypothetical protein VH256_03795 [Thermoleophilaceae bacterium]|jgi:hypothetical protein|nr:hypothetical protein [Thermoleophilaceae bacterium]